MANSFAVGSVVVNNTYTLSIGEHVQIVVQAADAGRLWNGFAVPVLTEAQAAIVGAAVGEPEMQAGESDGLQWERTI